MIEISIDSPFDEQLKFLYPYDDEEELMDRKHTILVHGNKLEVREKLENVLKYIDLGFVHYSKYNSDFQKFIRRDQGSNSEIPSLYEFFTKLSEKINDKDMNKLIDPEVIYYLYTNPNLIQYLDINGLNTIKKLNKKFPSYKPASCIQTFLVLPFYYLTEFDEKRETIYNLKQNIEYILSLDFTKYNFPNNFFDSKALDNIIFYDLNEHYKQNFSLKGVEILYEFYKFLGDSHIENIKDERIHYSLMFVKNSQLKMHEAKIEEFKNFFFKLMHDLKEAELADSFDNLLQKSVLKELIPSFVSFDYSNGLVLLNMLKHNLPYLKLNYEIIWYVIRPNIFDDDENKMDIIKNNIETLFRYLDEPSINRNGILPLINKDLVHALVETDRLVPFEQLKAIFDLNKIFKDRENILADKDTIIFVIDHNIKETSLNVEPLLTETMRRKSLDSQNSENLSINEKGSLRTEFSQNNLNQELNERKDRTSDKSETIKKDPKKDKVIIKIDEEDNIGYENRMVKIDRYFKIVGIIFISVVIFLSFISTIYFFIRITKL